MRHGNLIGNILYAVTLSCFYVLSSTGCLPDKTEDVTISTSSLPEGTVNQDYSTSVSGSGGTLPYTWSVTPALPDDLSFDTTTGAITGKPVTKGTSSHTFTLTDSPSSRPPQTVQRSLTLKINLTPLPLLITTTMLPGGTVGRAYNQPVQASGGTTGARTWSIALGTLPQDLSLNQTTGEISGTPTAADTSSFTVQVADTAGHTDTQVLSIRIIDSPSPLTIRTTTLPDGTVDLAYNQSVHADGGTGTLTWSLALGTLPQGLSPIRTTGEISGMPTVAGTSSFTVRVTDTAEQTDTQVLSIRIINSPSPLTITTPTLPGGNVGQAYLTSVSGLGGTLPYTWSVTPALPANLLFDTTTGAITGTPGTVGTSSHTFTLTDSPSSGSPQIVQRSLTLTINLTPAPLSIMTTTLPGGTVGLAYSEGLEATGGTGPLAWSRSGGSLPANLTLSPSGTISGTPTNAETSDFTVMVTDALSQSATQLLSIAVSAALTITTTSLPDARVDHSYSKTLQRSGGVSPFIWSVTPALPTGLSLNTSTGRISGTPAEGTEGTYSLTLPVEDSSTPTKQTASKVLSLRIRD